MVEGYLGSDVTDGESLKCRTWMEDAHRSMMGSGALQITQLEAVSLKYHQRAALKMHVVGYGMGRAGKQ